MARGRRSETGAEADGGLIDPGMVHQGSRPVRRNPHERGHRAFRVRARDRSSTALGVASVAHRRCRPRSWRRCGSNCTAHCTALGPATRPPGTPATVHPGFPDLPRLQVRAPGRLRDNPPSCRHRCYRTGRRRGAGTRVGGSHPAERGQAGQGLAAGGRRGHTHRRSDRRRGHRDRRPHRQRGRVQCDHPRERRRSGSRRVEWQRQHSAAGGQGGSGCGLH